MLRKTLLIILVFVLFLKLTSKAYSFEEFVPNNKVGVHIAAPTSDDLKDASKMVGRFGYVTMVVTRNDLDYGKWQYSLDSMREKVIPLFRLSGTFNTKTGCYDALTAEDAKVFADFFAKLNGVTSDMYFIIGNEVNHSTEWGCVVDPASYARVADRFIDTFKKTDPHFVMMLAALDLYAPHKPPQYYDASLYMRDMIQEKPDIFQKSDILAFHCYPPNDYTGSPSITGRHSISCHQWGVTYLRDIGAITGSKPLGITETGWKQGSLLSEDMIASYYGQAFEEVWMPDSSLRFITPFILNYCDYPFENMSLKQCGKPGYRKAYEVISTLPKVKAKPPRNETVTFEVSVKGELVVDSRYRFPIKLTNEKQGQRIYDSRLSDSLLLIDSPFTYVFGDVRSIAPGTTKEIDFIIKTNDKPGQYNIGFGLARDGDILELGDWQVTVLPTQALTLQLSQFPGTKPTACGYTVSVYDVKMREVFKKQDICSVEGISYIDKVKGVILGDEYTACVIRSGYTKSCKSVIFTKSANFIEMGMMLPFDRNGDGKFTFADLF